MENSSCLHEAHVSTSSALYGTFANVESEIKIAKQDSSRMPRTALLAIGGLFIIAILSVYVVHYGGANRSLAQRLNTSGKKVATKENEATDEKFVLPHYFNAYADIRAATPECEQHHKTTTSAATVYLSSQVRM